MVRAELKSGDASKTREPLLACVAIVPELFAAVLLVLLLMVLLLLAMRLRIRVWESRERAERYVGVADAAGVRTPAALLVAADGAPDGPWASCPWTLARG